MRRTLSVLLLLALVGPAAAQTVKLPAEVSGEAGDFVQVPATTDGTAVRWYVVDPGLRLFPVELLRDTRTAVVTAAKPGRYRLLAYTAKGDVPSAPAVSVIVIGGAPPTPPVPPDPGPPPKPTPTPGERHVLLIRETADSTPALARLIVALRAGPHAEYLKSKGHTLTVWDDDAVGPDGKPSKALQLWKPHYQGLKLPVLLILDSAGNAYRAAEVLPTATADDVIEAVKKAGG